MNPSIYFPFAKYEREIHSKESCYLKWQQENAVYDNSGKICAVPCETAEPYLKSSIDWMWYLIDAPQEYRNCDFSLFSDLELYFLLRERMELTLVTSWHNMKTEYKELLLAYHPELTENIAELQNLSGDHWQKILQIKPEYEIYCPWQKFSGNNWQVVLEEHPELAMYCDFSKLAIENWQRLLEKQSRFLPFCPQEVRKAFSDDVKTELFILYPEIKEIF